MDGSWSGRWPALAGAVAVDLAGAAALRSATGTLLGCPQRGSRAALAYLCATFATLLAGCGGLVDSLQNVLLLGAAAAATVPGGALLSAVLLAVGSVDWLPGAALLLVPLSLLAANASGTSRSAAGAAAGLSLPVTARRLAGYCCCFAATAAALAQTPRLLLPPQAAWLGETLGAAGWQPAVPALRAEELQRDALAWVGARTYQQPSHQRTALVLPAASLQPGLGVHWYLLAQAFPQFRAFFIYTLRALPSALMLPLALRFHQQPCLLLAAGALARCLLHPRPQLSMATLWAGLLPLAAPQLADMPGMLPWLGLGMGAALLLSASAAGLWLDGGGGNANFLYGMNLLWAGLQAVLLLRLLRIAARQEVARAGAVGTPAQAGGRAGGGK